MPLSEHYRPLQVARTRFDDPGISGEQPRDIVMSLDIRKMLHEATLMENQIRGKGVLNAEPTEVKYVIQPGLKELRKSIKKNPSKTNEYIRQYFEQKVLQEEVYKAFREANKFVLHLGSHIGVTVMSLGMVHGILKAIEKTHNNEHISTTLFVDTALYELYKPLEDTSRQITVLSFDQNNSATYAQNHKHFQERAIELIKPEDRVFLIDFRAISAQAFDKNTASKTNVNGKHVDITTLGRVFRQKSLKIGKYGEYERHALYINTLLGLTGPEAIQPNDAQPIMPSPLDEKEKAAQLMEMLQIDPNAIQIGLAMHASNPLKLYGLSSWRIILEQLHDRYRDLKQAYPKDKKEKVNFNLFCPPDTDAFPGFGMKDVKNEFGNLFADDPTVAIHFIQRPLVDVAALLSKQLFVLTNDTGLGHIAAGKGIPTYTLILPLLGDYWKLNEFHHLIIAKEDVDYATWYDRTMNPGFNKAINSIPPEEVVTIIENKEKLFSPF